jgi:hypothetical protein
MENKGKELLTFGDNPNYIMILLVLLIATFFLFVAEIKDNNDIKKDYGCYIGHVKECLQCQKENLTYLLCSGFCVPPRPSDLDGKGCPVVAPGMDCFNLPKECNL